jgi:photosystem II stability/assembly factor-like uncharacterized protein
MRRTIPVLAFVFIGFLSFCDPAGADKSRLQNGREVGRERGPQRVTIEEMERLADPAVSRIPVGDVPRPVRSAWAGMTWAFIGPSAIENEYWSGGTNAGGRVSSIVVDPRDGQTVYVAAAQGGVWKTTTGGASWTPLTDHLSSLASGALALDPSNPDVVYYGTGELHYCGDCFYGDGLFRSEDQGATWSKVATRFNAGSYIARVAVHATDPNRIFIAGNSGVRLSTNRGASWSIVLSGSAADDLALHPGDPEVVYATRNGSGVYKSTNRGLTWGLLAGGLPTSGFARINLAVAPSNGDVVYAAFVSSATSGLLGMYRTTDGGASWSALPATPNYLLGQGWYDQCLAVDPANPDVCYAGGVYPYGAGDAGIVRTSNGGATWSEISQGLDGTHPHPDQHAMAFGPDGSLWLGNDGGVWRTTNAGASWINRNTNLGIAQFYTVALHPTDPTSMLGGTQDNGTVRYDGDPGWPQQFGGDGGPSVYEWDSPEIFYTTYVFLSLMLRWNATFYEADVTGPWDAAGDAADWCNGPFLADPNQPNTLLAGSNRVWRTTNSGATWTALGGYLTDRLGADAPLRSIAVANGDPDHIYAGNATGDVFVTQDAANWTLVNSGLPQGAVGDIALDPLDAQTAYVCIDRSSSSRVFRTTNGGASWTSLTGNLPGNLRAMSLAVDFRPTPDRLYLGTDYGVWDSGDDGVNWVRSGTDLPAVAVYDLALDVVNDVLTAATHGRGMWRANLDVTGPVVEVLSPNGGETVTRLTLVPITWSASDPAGVTTVDILLSTDGGATYPVTIAAGVPHTGSFDWNVTQMPPADCRVRVVARDGVGNPGDDASDADFSIDGLVAVPEPPAGRFAFDSPFPNPGGGATRLSFELPREVDVALDLFDAQGRRVRSVARGTFAAGRHAVTWDGRDATGAPVAEGVYLARLRAGTLERSRRLVRMTR